MKPDGSYGRPNGVAVCMQTRLTVAEQRKLPMSLVPKEAEPVLGISANKICQLLRDKKLPGRKVGGTWRIPTAKLFAFLAGEDID